MNMQGRRIDASPDEEKNQYPYPRLQPGDYGKDIDGIWHCCPPGKDPFSFIGNLAKHKIIEHEDGTITVSPSILIISIGTWHGYLEKGIWREC